MNPKLQIAKETLKGLRNRRCVQRVVVLRLTTADARLLKEILAVFGRDYDDTQANRNALLLANQVYKSLRDQLQKTEQDNDALCNDAPKI